MANVKTVAYMEAPGAAVDAAPILDAARAAVETAAGGRIILGPGIHDCLSGNAGIKLTPDNTNTRGWIEIEWMPGAVMRLSNSCVRGVDFTRSADYDTFRRIRLINPVINANSTVGNGDAVIGTWQNSVHLQRVNFEDIEILGGKIYNLPATLPTDLRAAVWLDSNEPGSPPGTYPGPTPMIMNRITVRDLEVIGGDFGVAISATPSGASQPTGTNHHADRVVVENCDISLNGPTVATLPAAGLTQSGIIIGGSGTCGKVRVRDNTIRFSTDVAIEVDGAQDLICDGNVTIDSKNGVYLANYHSALDLDNQRAIISNHKHIVSTAWPNTLASSRAVGANFTVNPYGAIKIRDLTYESDGLDGASAATVGNAINGLGSFRDYDIDGLDVDVTNSQFDSASLMTHTVVELGCTLAGGRIGIRNARVRVHGDRTGAGSINQRTFRLSCSDGVIEIGPSVFWDLPISGTALIGGTHGVLIGEAMTGIATTTVRGYCIGLRGGPGITDTSPRGIRFGTGVVIDGRFMITHCNFKDLLSTSDADIVYADNTVRAALVMSMNEHRGTTLRPFEVTGTWDPASVASGAATSTTLTLNGAAIGDEVTVTFSQAVPAGVLLTAHVTAANTITVTLANLSGAAVDLASGTLRARNLRWML